MSNTLQWVYNHVDPNFITTMLLGAGMIVFLYGVLLHSKTNKKMHYTVIGIAIMIFAAWNVNNLLWHNTFDTHAPRSGYGKVITVGSDLYTVNDDDLNRIVLTKINLYDESFISKFRAIYGDAGSANDILMLYNTPKPIESSDCSEPTKITSK